MEKMLKIGVIIAFIAILSVIVDNIYNDFVLPNIYNKNTKAVLTYGENIYEKCDNAVIKYITSVRENERNIRYFIPSIKRNSAKTKAFMTNLNENKVLKLGKVYIINEDTYMAEYTVFTNTNKNYKVVIKFNENRNNYKILYDELYEEGKEAK